MTHDYRKEYLGDGAYARIEDDGSLVRTAENGVQITDEVCFAQAHSITALLNYIRANYPIQFSLSVKNV